MADFFTIIGNDAGVIMFFTPKQLDGTYYTTAVLEQLNEMAGLPNTASQLANKNGIYDNSDDGKMDFYHKIRRFVLPTEVDYDFRVRVFVHPSLSEAEALTFIKAGNILGLIALGTIEELTVVNDTNGFLAKVIG